MCYNLIMETIEGLESRVTLHERLAAPTERTGDFYLSIFGLYRPDLAGKTIMNVGSGGSDLQADLAVDKARVINVDLRNKNKKQSTMESTLVAGDMVKLPFQDNSADLVVSLWASFHPPKNVRTNILSEMVRVSRDRVMIYPCYGGQKVEDYIDQNNLQPFLEFQDPPGNPKLILANLNTQKNPLSKFARLLNNANYTFMESIIRLFGAKRLTINAQQLKANPECLKILENLVNSGI
jgi:ubiquinone/menaquinone biosynthesis C-methylase UbiE